MRNTFGRYLSRKKEDHPQAFHSSETKVLYTKQKQKDITPLSQVRFDK
jgi:hypothetical protein